MTNPSQSLRFTMFWVGASSFVVKGVCALALTLTVASHFTADDFALWSLFFSIFALVTSADLGVGQLVLTTVFESRASDGEKQSVFSNAVVAMCVVSVAVLLLGVAIGWWIARPHLAAVALAALVVTARLPLVPFGAALAGLGRYGERKLWEALAYAVALMWAVLAFRLELSMVSLLLLVNACITGGSVIAATRLHLLGFQTFSMRSVNSKRVVRVCVDAVPYFIANVGGLVVYSGFVVMSATVLEPVDTARVALLHSVVFMTAYQVIELVCRINQTGLLDEHLYRRMGLWVIGASIVMAVGLVSAGPSLLMRVAPAFTYSYSELAVWGAFVGTEALFLLPSTRLLMILRARHSVSRLAVLRLVAFAAAAFGALALTSRSLEDYLLCLLLMSFVTLLYAHGEVRMMRTRVSSSGSSMME